MTMPSPYHHGRLREVALAETAIVIGRSGVSALSLRSLAETIGVTHTALAHHFGSREGLLNALAVEGYSLLRDRLRAAMQNSFLEVGVAYVEFAIEHPGHFAVMYAPDLLYLDEPALAEARLATFEVLRSGSQAAGGDPRAGAEAATAAWSLVHGLATLLLSGSLPASGLSRDLGTSDPAEIARRAARHLFIQDPRSP